MNRMGESLMKRETPGTSPDVFKIDETASSRSLVDEIADTIAAEICGSKYEPGERILHQDLTTRFNVSFTPIREALLKLERERLIEILPRRGARVVRLTLDEIENLLAIRCAIVPVMARAAVSRGTDEQIAAFKTEADTSAGLMRSDAPVEEVMLQSYRAAAILAQAARNDFAALVSHTTARQPNWAYAHRGLETEEERATAARLWEHLAAAVFDRDGAAAAAAAEEMVLRSVHAVLPKLVAEMDPGGRPAEERLKIFPALRNTSKSKESRKRKAS
jgi:DNA-binding GntR family transcriptional regulator